ncbi:hypothetical protein MNBD_ALPHA09-390 [hydrothermal vent metagenome]|uniref:DUF2336 domain-containing protein n=1 Tax=hydrothermal vent metagenome TaxID=652676 RepID=A0A3B0U0G8_9ZZZZ
MPTFLPVDEFQSIPETPVAARRAELAKQLYADFEAGALDAPERRAALSVFRALVRDGNADVRHDFARFVAPSGGLPAELAAMIANDGAGRIAAPFLRLGVALDDNLLVDVVGRGQGWRQTAVARRRCVNPPVCAAIAEVGCARSIVTLLKNPGANLPSRVLGRIGERHGQDDQIADLLLARPNVPGDFVEARIMMVSGRLKAFVEASGWMGPEYADCAVANAVEHGLVEFAVGREYSELEPLFAKWNAEGRITGGFVLRAACYGAISVLELALVKLANLPPRRVAALISDPCGYGRQSLIARAGFGGAEEDFIVRAIARFSDTPPRRGSYAWAAAVASGIEEVIADGASPEAFSVLLEGFATDAGLAMPARDDQCFDQAA